MMLQNLGIDPSFTMPPPSSGGMFGGGGDASWKNALMAAVAGFMARRSPGVANNIINGMQDAQTMKQRMAMLREQRTADLQDQKDLIDYRALHDAPPAPHYFESNSGDQYAIGPDGKPTEVFHDPMRYKFVPNGMGGVVPVDISKLMGGAQSAAPKPLSDEEMQRLLGGAGGNASGGFPGPGY